jgi:hypothetical protein
MALPATDTFTGLDAAEALTTYSANWTAGLGAFEGAPGGGAVQGVSGGDLLKWAFWNADSFNNNQYAQCVVTLTSSSAEVGVAVRCDATNGYLALVSGDGNLYLIKVVSGAYVGPDLDTATGIASGSVIKVTADGTTIKVYDDGVEVCSATDSSLTAGAAGISGYSSVEGLSLDNWEGGNISGDGSSALAGSASTGGHGTASPVFSIGL